MTAYFDDLSHRVGREISVVEAEKSLIQHAILVCGDKEFPNDLREKIMTIIAVEAVYPLHDHTHEEQKELGFLNEKSLKYAVATCSSKLIPSLHEAFHEVGERRITTRFGLLTDDPLDNLRTRERWEIEKYGKEE